MRKATASAAASHAVGCFAITARMPPRGGSAAVGSVEAANAAAAGTPSAVVTADVLAPPDCRSERRVTGSVGGATGGSFDPFSGVSLTRT